MADVKAFRGVHFARGGDISSLLAPPYDVIDEDMRRSLAEQDKHNVIDLILPEGEGEQKYDNAASLWRAWQDKGVLTQDDVPCLYRYHQTFQVPGTDSYYTRKGFIAAVRLAEFDERVVLRHEKTLKGPKIDRLNLMKATGAHFSQIFTMYDDPQKVVDKAFAGAEESDALATGTTADGTKHSLWAVADSDIVTAVHDFLADKQLYIADGHHRYETMLAYRKHLRQQHTTQANSAVEFGMMFLVNMADPGLVVLPTHRLVHSLSDATLSKLEAALERWFNISPIDMPKNAEELKSQLGQGTPRFIMAKAGQSQGQLLRLRDDVDVAAELGVHSSVAALDVTVLHGLVFEKILGITAEAQAAQTNLDYYKSTAKALKHFASTGQLLFLMRATPAQQVRAVADADQVMPQKSTFFFPKIASGLVFNPVTPDESL